MSYTALYRKFRPDNFADVKGQDHIVTTLTNQIKHNRIGHAYLFCGTRGTGKTTVAKILAKAVNCEHPVNGSPCNECAMCKAIQAGTAMNVIEIDAESTMVWIIYVRSEKRFLTALQKVNIKYILLMRFICFPQVPSMPC